MASNIKEEKRLEESDGNGKVEKKSKKEKKSEKKKNIKLDSIQHASDIEKEEIKLGPENFKIIALLGVGSQGRVYLVELVGTNSYYAMKVFKKTEILSNHKVLSLSFLSLSFI